MSDKESDIQLFADKYPSLDSIHLAIMDIARLSHAGKHGQRVKELLEKLIAVESTAPAPQPAETTTEWKVFSRDAHEYLHGTLGVGLHYYPICAEVPKHECIALVFGKTDEEALRRAESILRQHFVRVEAATPQVTPDTQWIKPKFPATTPGEWREFGKTHFHAATPQVTPTLKEILKQYGAHHIRDCDALNKWKKLPCDCGFAALIEGTSEQASPTPDTKD